MRGENNKVIFVLYSDVVKREKVIHLVVGEYNTYCGIDFLHEENLIGFTSDGDRSEATCEKCKEVLKREEIYHSKGY